MTNRSRTPPRTASVLSWPTCPTRRCRKPDAVPCLPTGRPARPRRRSGGCVHGRRTAMVRGARRISGPSGDASRLGADWRTRIPTESAAPGRSVALRPGLGRDDQGRRAFGEVAGLVRARRAGWCTGGDVARSFGQRYQIDGSPNPAWWVITNVHWSLFYSPDDGGVRSEESIPC